MTEALSDPTIQTPAGPPEDATGHWRVSLAEIDALGRKAARGAGYPWGMAEEAGRAARWLAAWGLPGPETLLAALEEMDGAVGAHAPRAGSRPWQAAASALCPICTGAALSDRAEEIRDGAPQRLSAVLFPLLMLPALCRAARDLDFAIRLDGGAFKATATREGPAAADWGAADVSRLDSLVIARAEQPPCPPLRQRPDAHRLPVAVWRGLDRFAHRTYAPATEASRQGAGAGVRDTD